MKTFLYKLYLKYFKPTNRFARVGFSLDTYDKGTKGAFYKECNSLRNENTVQTLCDLIIAEIEYESLYVSNHAVVKTTSSGLYSKEINGVERIIDRLNFYADLAVEEENEDKSFINDPI